jgi:uncharacterized protein YqjF (DUF2071 family)
MSGRLPDSEIDRALTTQTWADLTFLHWRFPAAAVQRLLPAGLEADIIDGSAWVALVPFVMCDVRLVGLPPFPRLSRFPELNVRTYVRGPDGHDGIYFLRLFTPRPAFNWALRSAGVQYRFAHARHERSGTRRSYGFRRPGDPSGRPLLAARVEVGEALAVEEHAGLLDSLTGRWNAYARRAGHLLRLPVEHEPWLLHAATARAPRWPLTDFGLPEPRGRPLAHAAPAVHARFGAPSLLRVR